MTFMKKIKIRRSMAYALLVMGCLLSIVLAWGVPNQSALAATEDDTSARVITIHKYTQGSSSSTNSATGTTTDAGNVPSDSEPLQGIKFTVTRVQKVSGKDLSAADSSTYKVDDTFKAKTVTTNADGEAKADVGTGPAADGYYLVTEQASKLVTAGADPFIVHLPQTTKDASTGDTSILYSVDVYPKNEVDENALALNPEKFVQDAQATPDSSNFTPEVSATSAVTGTAVQWDLVVTRPADIETTDDSGKVTYAKQLVLSDPLISKNLNYVGFMYFYFLTPDGSKVKLEQTDYDDSNASLKNPTTEGDYRIASIALTASGIQKFAEQPEGTKLVIPLATVITPDVSGVIRNTFDTYYQGTATKKVIHEHSGTNKPLTDGATNVLKPTLPTSADASAPVVYTGNVTIHKTDEDGKSLAGATFKLYPSLADAKAGTKAITDGNHQVLTAKSGSDGIAQFIGLVVDPNTQQQDYYAVETDAPSGYDLNGKAFKVTAKRDTDVDATVQDPASVFPNLPLTGRTGRILLYTLAGVLILIGGTGIVITKRRRAR
jgi:LPXTG-motif cell wall-anchored protein